MTDKTQTKTIKLAELEMTDETAENQVATAQPNALAAPRPDAGGMDGVPDSPGGGWLVWLGCVFALLWMGAAGAFIWGYLGVQSLDDLARYGFGQLTGLSVFALAPALLFIMGGLMAREVRRNGHNTRRVEIALRRLAEPAHHAESEVRSLSTAVAGEVERINAALESALARLAAMEEVITHHADTLEQSASDARDRTETLLSGLRAERQRLSEVSESLDDKAALIAAAISDQSKMVAAAAELAASQASDSERRIRASVDDLNAAGSSIVERSDKAALILSERTGHLRDLSETLKERSENLDAAYVKHRQRLADAGEALRAEQEKIATALDFHKAELEVMAKTAGEGASALNDAAAAGALAFREAVEAAVARADDLASRVRAETDNAASEHEAALARLVAAAQEAKTISDAAIEAIEAQADVIAAKVEKTNESAYEAARRSDEAFEQRLAEADKLTQRASRAADEAGEAVRKRLSEVLQAARQESEAVERHIETMTNRLSEMPDMARDRAREAADALRWGLDGLNAAALAAAEEAQEIDAAFQARIRQNYELLSDFMLRMGSVAGGRRAPDLGLNELPDPLVRRRRSEPAAEAPSEPSSPAAEDAPKAEKTDPVPDAARQGPQPADRSNRRAGDPGWRWKDLLSSMPEDQDDTPAPSSRRRRKSDDD